MRKKEDEEEGRRKKVKMRKKKEDEEEEEEEMVGICTALCLLLRKAVGFLVLRIGQLAFCLVFNFSCEFFSLFE